jgi:hypothetical protein
MKGIQTIALGILCLPWLASAQVHNQGTTTNNLNSSAIGIGCSATGAAALASGLNSQSGGTGAHAFGMNANAQGIYSFAAGYSAQSAGGYSMALGTLVKATATRSFIIGSGYGTSMMVNNAPNTFMAGFNSDLPTFFIGSSSGTGTTGRIGIATINPEAKLDVNAGTSDGLLVRTDHTAAGGYGIRCLATNPSTEAFSVISNSDTSLRIFADGSVRMDNTLTAKEVKVRLDVWKDDILKPGATLMSLDSLNDYIAQHGHLPGIPPEAEALAVPVDLGLLSVALLGKIEEITLQLIRLDQKITTLEQDLPQLHHPPSNTLSR